MAFSEEFLPTCHRAEDDRDPTGCAGLCAIEEQVCHRLDDDAYRCCCQSSYRMAPQDLIRVEYCMATLK